ncbi:MAG: glycoside hydrolase family 18 protein [Candidatus Cryptobacteroides sp.]
MDEELDEWSDPTVPDDDKIFIAGYLPTYQINDMTDWGFIPHVDRVYFNGLCPNPEGVFDPVAGYTENLLTTLGKIQGRCEVYLSIGGGRGFRPDAMAELCLNPEKIPPYLDAFDAYLKENGIYGAVDGIDIDWEGPRVDDAAYLVFLQAIKERFPDKGLTAAISSRHPSRAGNLIGALDEINMMCYTRFENGEHVPMSIFTRAIDEYLEVGVPKEKLLVGVPFYGRTDNLQDTEAVTYREVYESVPNLSPDVNSFVKGGKTFLYNGYTLISQKGEYLRRKKIKGVMVWELAQDISYSNPLSLLRALTMANASPLVAEAGVTIGDVNDFGLDSWNATPIIPTPPGAGVTIGDVNDVGLDSWNTTPIIPTPPGAGVTIGDVNDVGLDSWNTTPTIPTPPGAGVTIGDVNDVGLDSWNTIPPIPTPIPLDAGVTIGDVNDVGLDSWNTTPPIPTPIPLDAGVTIGSVNDVGLDSWNTTPPIPTPIPLDAGVTIGDVNDVGLDSWNTTPTVPTPPGAGVTIGDVNDVGLDSWNTTPPTPTPPGAGLSIGDVNDVGLDSWNTTPPTPPDPGDDDKIFIAGYLPTYQINDMTDWGFIPHVDRVYFNGLCPNPEGVFDPVAGYTENLLTTLGKIQGRCEVYLSIGGGRGFRPDAMAELCLNPEKIPPYLDAFDAYLKENGIYGAVDGIDIDWEGPRVDDAAYLVFLQAIKERFPDKGLTAAISSRHPSRAGNLIGALDEINMMCYTRFENGEHVPMSIFTRAIDEYLEVGVPKEKLLVGVPFYGRTDNLQDTEAVTYREVYESVPNLSPDVNSFVKGGKTFLYNGYTLISQKGEYLRRKKIKGVMVWELAQDISYSNPLSLLRALTMANAGSLVEAGVAIEDVDDIVLDD